MSIITDYASRTVRFLRGRVGARLLLILSCVICISLFSPYIKTVNINADGEIQKFITLRDDPQEIMTQYGLAIDSNDTYKVVSNDTSDFDAEITVLRAFGISINDAGSIVELEISEGTVAEALASASIPLPDSDDVINHRLDEEVYAYMEINIDRVEYQEAASYQTIDYKTIKHETSELLKGETRVSVKGSCGEKRVVMQRKFVNGALESEAVISETVTKDVINEVIDVGTASATTTTAATTAKTTSASKTTTTKKTTTPSTLSTKPASGSAKAGTFTDAHGSVVAYSKVLTGKGTAYTADKGSLTSTGREVQSGIVAVDPSIIPYGTRLYIVSADGKYDYGYALAADTGGALKRGEVLVDLFYDTESQCHAFGRRDVVVYVL